MIWFARRRVFLDVAGGRDNPSAVHMEGRQAKRLLEEARGRIARVLHTSARNVVFTSGGTESDNLAVLGVSEAARGRFARPHIIISAAEHPAVYESAREAERRGAALSIVPVTTHGRVSESEVMDLVTDQTVLISISLVDSVTGARQPIEKIARRIRERRRQTGSAFPYLHTDVAQALRTVEVSTEKLGADLVSLDGSKFGGPEGSGLLVVRSGIELRPLMFGGGQERGWRPGTERVTVARALSDALEHAVREREARAGRTRELRDIFIRHLVRLVPDIEIRTPLEASAADMLAVSVPGIMSEFLAVALDGAGVAASAGSACGSNGPTDDAALLRFSFDRTVTPTDLGRTADIFSQIVKRAKIDS